MDGEVYALWTPKDALWPFHVRRFLFGFYRCPPAHNQKHRKPRRLSACFFLGSDVCRCEDPSISLVKSLEAREWLFGKDHSMVDPK